MPLNMTVRIHTLTLLHTLHTSNIDAILWWARMGVDMGLALWHIGIVSGVPDPHIRILYS